MKKKISCLLVVAAIALSGCAGARGALVGVMGGIPLVDEYTHNDVDPNSMHTNLKEFGHQSAMIATVYVLWPLAAAYGGVSAVYGAYQFWKYEKKNEFKSNKITIDLNELRMGN